jgi:hypothetical protein
MYTVKNYKTKKELREAIEAWLESGKDPVRYYQPGPFGGNEPRDGHFVIEGPHYPQPHRWYAECEARGGLIVKVRR